jgi:hypothetical protein
MEGRASLNGMAILRRGVLACVASAFRDRFVDRSVAAGLRGTCSPGWRSSPSLLPSTCRCGADG